MEQKVSLINFCKLIISKDYWIRVFRIGFPICLIFEALTGILINAVIITIDMPYCLKHFKSLSICIGEKGLFVGFILSALLVLCGSIGLIMKKGWARIFIFITFPHHLVFWTLLLYSDSILSALSRISLGIIFYFMALYVYTRPKVKEQFR